MDTFDDNSRAIVNLRKRKGMKDFTISEDINSLNPIIIEKLAPPSMFRLEDEKVADLEKNLRADKDNKEVSQIHEDEKREYQS
mmetsp:Transcript_31381/g.30897  ORF Transcript_31381/g.30897 Transcript_31381/m.30897 type:complete len:83 (+) Transcript_31381:28-276(+)